MSPTERVLDEDQSASWNNLCPSNHSDYLIMKGLARRYIALPNDSIGTLSQPGSQAFKASAVRQTSVIRTSAEVSKTSFGNERADRLIDGRRGGRATPGFAVKPLNGD